MGKIKNILMIASMTLLALSCTNESPFGSSDYDVKVKSETKWELNATSGERLHKLYYKEFDKSDNLSVYIEFNEGVLVSKSLYSYKEKSSTETITTYNEAGVVTSNVKNQYSFNSFGKISEKVKYDSSGKMLNREVYEYDLKGNIEKRLNYNPSGVLVATSVYTNKYINGNLVERNINENSGNSSIVTRDSLMYNTDKNRIDIINYNSDGAMQNIITYIYNVYGKISFQTETTPAGVVTKKYEFVYEYFK